MRPSKIAILAPDDFVSARRSLCLVRHKLLTQRALGFKSLFTCNHSRGDYESSHTNELNSWALAMAGAMSRTQLFPHLHAADLS